MMLWCHLLSKCMNVLKTEAAIYFLKLKSKRDDCCRDFRTCKYYSQWNIFLVSSYIESTTSFIHLSWILRNVCVKLNPKFFLLHKLKTSWVIKHVGTTIFSHLWIRRRNSNQSERSSPEVWEHRSHSSVKHPRCVPCISAAVFLTPFGMSPSWLRYRLCNHSQDTQLRRRTLLSPTWPFQTFRLSPDLSWQTFQETSELDQFISVQKSPTRWFNCAFNTIYSTDLRISVVGRMENERWRMGREQEVRDP